MRGKFYGKAKTYRQLAQAQLKKNYGACLYLSLLTAALTAVTFWVPFGGILFSGALAVGASAFYLHVARTGKTNIKLLFSTFTGNIANIFVTDILMGLFLFFWALVPFAGFIIAFVKSYSYAMAPYILIDNPEMNGCDAITASRKMMRGKKFKLFCLELSYIGWNILCVLTFGILNIWVAPRIAVARAAFYETAKACDAPIAYEAPVAPATI